MSYIAINTDRGNTVAWREDYEISASQTSGHGYCSSGRFVRNGNGSQCRATQPVKKAVYQLALATPSYCVAEHNVGEHRVGVTNYGCLGSNYHDGLAVDCFTGESIKWGEYPKGSGNVHLFGGVLWAVHGRNNRQCQLL